MGVARMPPRSFAGDTSDSRWRWLLFARQLRVDAFVLTVVTYSKNYGVGNSDDAHESVRAMYELQLDASGLRAHTEELGIEVGLEAFAELFTNTLAMRTSVDVALGPQTHDAPASARLLLSYKFSESISRRGTFALPLVSSAVPPQAVDLLAALHATPHTPVLTAAQQFEREAAARPTISAAELAARTLASSTLPASRSSGAMSQRPLAASSSTMTTSSTNSSSVSTNTEATGAGATPLKRRPMPTGAIRRKGPRGAKLAKH